MTQLAPGAGGVEASAGLEVALGRLSDEVRDTRDAMGGTLIPTDARPRAQAVMPASGNLVLPLGGPTLGEVWLVRRLSAGGRKWGTVAAGTCEWYASAVAPGTIGTDQDLAELVAQFAGLPANVFYSGRQIVLRQHEQLFAVVVGGTAAQLYTASAQVVVYREQRERSVFDL